VRCGDVVPPNGSGSQSFFNVFMLLLSSFSFLFLTKASTSNMEAALTVPTPKTPTQMTSRDDRLRIQTLFNEAGWEIDDIVLQLNLTRRQVLYALENRLTPQKHKTGRPLLLDTPKRKHLISWVTANAQNRRVPRPDIPAYLGWGCTIKAIRGAFKKEGYVRRIARRKPPISEAN
jgi:hypothetical protein